MAFFFFFVRMERREQGRTGKEELDRVLAPKVPAAFYFKNDFS